MILRDGRNTRDEAGPFSPYCDEMAVVLDSYWSDGDPGDAWTCDDMGNGVARYGRRLFFWDDRGFLSSRRYANPFSAGVDFAAIAISYDDGDDDQ